MTTSLEDIIKNHILGEIFSEFPNNERQHAFDFFLSSDVNCAEFVGDSPLGTEWDFTVFEQYSYDNIKGLRGLMQSMYDDLEKLKSSLFQYAVTNLTINKSDFNTEDAFYETVQNGNGTLYKEGAEHGFAIIHTVDTEAVS